MRKSLAFGQKRAQTIRYRRTFRTSLLTSEHSQNVQLCSVARRSVSQGFAKNALEQPDITEHFRTCSNIVRFVRLSNHRTIFPLVYRTGGIVRGTAWWWEEGKSVCRLVTDGLDRPCPKLAVSLILFIFLEFFWIFSGSRQVDRTSQFEVE